MHDLKNLECLLPKTQKLLIKMVEGCPFLDKYVLVGGSALAIYLCHRKSEDLDFFTYDDDFDRAEIFDYIQSFKNKEILNQTDEQIDLLIDGVKVTFFNAQWKFLEPKKPKSFNLSSIEAIASMKVNVMFLRAKYRDYFDLYSLVKSGMSLKEIFDYSQDIVEGVTFKLFAIALVYIDDIEDDNIDYLEPKEKISKEEIRDFFQRELDRI
jgi:predicted nucleotidyltransferase component of viral defense system